MSKAADDTYVASLEAQVAEMGKLLSGPESIVLPPGVKLSATLRKVLGAIIAGEGKPVPPVRIRAALYTRKTQPASDVVKVYVCNLRQRLAGHITITSEHGVGYAISAGDIAKLTGKEPWK